MGTFLDCSQDIRFRTKSTPRQAHIQEKALEKDQHKGVITMAKLERTYNVPLRKGFINKPKHKRAKKATKTLKEFLEKHMKSDRIRIGQHLNHEIWKNGMKNPPHHVKVKAVKDEDGVVEVELEGYEFTETVRPEEPVAEGGLMDRLTGKDVEEEVQKAVDEKAKKDTESKEEKTKSESKKSTKETSTEEKTKEKSTSN